MSPFLLDVDVLIALFREDHVAHKPVKHWFQQTGARSLSGIDFVARRINKLRTEARL